MKKKIFKKTKMKSFIAIIIASSILYTAIPVFAIESNDKTIQENTTSENINAKDSSTTNLEVIPETSEEDENNENYNKPSGDNNWETFSDDEISKGKTDAKEASEKEQEQAKAKKEKEQELYTEYGAFAVKELIKIAKSDEDKSELAKEIIVDITKKVNNDFVKKIPYYGGILFAIINEITGDDSSASIEKVIGDKLDVIKDTLEKINTNITNNTDRLIVEFNKTALSEKIKTLQNAFEIFDSEFDKKLYIEFSKDLNYLLDHKNSESLSNFCNKIYDVNNNRNFYNGYVTFVNKLLNRNNIIPDFIERGGNKDLFALNDIVLSKNDKTAIVEFNPIRSQLLNIIKEKCAIAKNMLITAMKLEAQKYQSLKDIYTQAANELQAQMDNTIDEEEKTEIANQFKLCIISSDNAETALAIVCSDLFELGYSYENSEIISIGQTDQNRPNTAEQALQDRLTSYDQEIQNDADINAKLRKSQSEFKGLEVNHMTYQSEIINNIKTWPVFNAEKSQIEYLDQYGNVKGTRSIATDYTSVKYTDLKIGNVYKLLPTGIVKVADKVSKWFIDKFTSFGKLPDARKIVRITKFYLNQKVYRGSPTCLDGDWTVEWTNLNTGTTGKSVLGKWYQFNSDSVKFEELKVGDIIPVTIN